jgi:hypothetical protein
MASIGTINWKQVGTVLACPAPRSKWGRFLLASAPRKYYLIALGMSPAPRFSI